MEKQRYRTEQDLIGSLDVPTDALYGIQTQRALDLYPLNGEKSLADYPELLVGMLQVKKAAALANIAADELEPGVGHAIATAIDKLIDTYPKDQFPVHAFHGGGGISSNMNLNEVIANLANRDTFDQPVGSYTPIHPNDHVNLNNSTSDVLSTACHIAVIKKWAGLKDSLQHVAETLQDQKRRWQDTQKLARTCLQDAVEISFGDLFSGYQAFINRNSSRIDIDVQALYQVNLGGNIIGRPGDCSETVFDDLIARLNEVIGSEQFARSDNLFDASQNNDPLVAVASSLELFARGLIKIAKDFRLMSSGPECGLGEIVLPAVQPGSSAMPGKVNPTIPEFLIQCCMQAVGKCHCAQMTLDHGELDYTPWQSLVISNLLDAMACLENGIRTFNVHCLKGVDINMDRNSRNANSLIPTIIRLKKARGYAFASQVFKETGGDLTRIREHLNQDGPKPTESDEQ